jgi:hypothetical protein
MTGLGSSIGTKTHRLPLRLLALLSLLICVFPITSQASSGTEGAAFLDIPVGGGPAALGAAYSALANDAYASTLNPGGLGFLPSTQFAGQHLSYIESVYYEHLSFAVPLPRSSACLNSETCLGSALGGSIQYLGSGDINGTDVNANPTGTFSTHYAAYNLSYGRAFSDRLSLGITGKWINAKIDDVTANAYAADFGSMYKATDKLTLAAVMTNLGTKLTFLDQSDSLPLAFHLGAAYRPVSQWNLSAEGVYPQTGLASAHFGIEWHPLQMIAIRTGYRTDTVKENGALAGFTTGLGLQAFGQEFAYAWVPVGDLGNTHYFSLLIHLGETNQAKRNLIQYQTIKQHRAAQGGSDDIDPDYQQLMEIISNDDSHLAQSNLPESSREK